jgi:prepilin-type N-terminal cleavage/methylation domain-containing protein
MEFLKAKNRVKKFKKTGFTLIELMIVIAIIGILAGIAVPRYMNFLQRAKEGASKGGLGALRSALNIYYADTDFYFPIVISIDPAWPVRLFWDDGFGWIPHPDFQNYLDEIPDCKVGPEPSGFQVTRHDIWHQGLHWFDLAPNPGAPDVGWWYYRSTDPVTGLVTAARFFCNVQGNDQKGVYYTTW